MSRLRYPMVVGAATILGCSSDRAQPGTSGDAGRDAAAQVRGHDEVLAEREATCASAAGRVTCTVHASSAAALVPPWTVLGQAVEQIAHDAQVGCDPQSQRAGVGSEVRCDAIRQPRKDRHAQRLGGLDGHALGQNAIDTQAEVGVLLGAAQRQYRAVVARQVVLDLQPVHVGYPHG